MEQKFNQQPSAAFVGASWFALVTGIVAFIIGLWNADLWLSEKGFFGMSFTLSLFAAIAVQKNTRDLTVFEEKANF